MPLKHTQVSASYTLHKQIQSRDVCSRYIAPSIWDLVALDLPVAHVDSYVCLMDVHARMGYASVLKIHSTVYLGH